MLFIKYYWGDQIKKDVKGMTHDTNVNDEKCIHNFIWKTRR